MNKARLDIRARGVWERGPKAFLDIRVFDPNACCYFKKSLQQYDVINEQEKKRAYNDRVLQIGHGAFTPLFVFSIYGNIWKDLTSYVLFKIIQFDIRET